MGKYLVERGMKCLSIWVLWQKNLPMGNGFGGKSKIENGDRPW